LIARWQDEWIINKTKTARVAAGTNSAEIKSIFRDSSGIDKLRMWRLRKGPNV
jgi:hypothetical protein